MTPPMNKDEVTPLDADGLDVIEALVADAAAIEGVANVHEGSSYYAERLIRRAIEQGNLKVVGPDNHPAMRSHTPVSEDAIQGGLAVGESDVRNCRKEDAGGGGVQSNTDQHSRPVGRGGTGSRRDARPTSTVSGTARPALDPGKPESHDPEPQLGGDELREKVFALLCRKYVQRSDARQQSMGLQYTAAETHDLAETIAKFIEVILTAQAKR